MAEQPTEKPPVVALALLSVGVALVAQGVATTSMLWLIPGAVFMSASGDALFRRLRWQAETQPHAAPTATFLGMLAQPLRHSFVATSVSVAGPREAVEHLASQLNDGGVGLREKTGAFAEAVDNAGWFGHRLVRVECEAAAVLECAAWEAALEVARSESESSYRGEMFRTRAEKSLVTWILVLHVTGSVPRLSGLGALKFEWWLDELLGSDLTVVLESKVVVLRHIHGDVERLSGPLVWIG